MASGTNNLTLRLSVQDRNFKAGLDRAQKKLIDFQKSVATTFGQRSLGKMDRFAANLDKIAQSVVKLDRALSSMGVTKLDASMKSASNTSRKLSRDINKMSGAADKGAVSNNRLGASARKASLSLNTMRKSSARTAEALRSTILNTTYLVTALVGGAATIKTVKFGAEFEKRLGEIDTLLNQNTVSIGRYQEQLVELSKASPKTLMDLSGALYQIISAGIPAVEGAGGAFDILNRSQKLAVGSISETKAAADLLITTMSAFEGQNIGAAEAADKLTAIYQKGRTTIPQLSRAFGRAAPIAAQFGVNIDELGGLLISLTRAGLNTNESVTGIRALMSSLAKPTKKTSKILKELNIDFGEAAIQQKGFSGVLDDLILKTGGSAEVLAKIFPNIRALLPAVITASQGFGGFSANVDSVTNSIGAADQAVLKQQKRFFFAAELLRSNFQGVIQEIAQKALPGLTVQLSRLSRFISENRESIVSFGQSAMKTFSTIGAAGFKALVSLTDILSTIFKIFTSLPGKILLATTALLKFGQAGLGSLSSGFGMIMHLFDQSKWSAAGAKAGAAAAASAGAAAGAGAEVAGRNIGSRLTTALTGVLRIGGVVAIGAMLAQSLWAGYKEVSDEEELKAAERQKRFFEDSVRRLASGVSTGFRERQGVDVTEAGDVRGKIARGSLFKEEDEELGDARDVKQDFSKRLKERRAQFLIDLKTQKKQELGVESLSRQQILDIDSEFRAKEKEIRSQVLQETITFHQNLVDAARSESNKERKTFLTEQRDRLAELNQELESFKGEGISDAFDKIGQAFSKVVVGTEALTGNVDGLEANLLQVRDAIAKGADTSFFDEQVERVRELTRAIKENNAISQDSKKSATDRTAALNAVNAATTELMAIQSKLGESFPAVDNKIVEFAVTASNAVDGTDESLKAAIESLGHLGDLAKKLEPKLEGVKISAIDERDIDRANNLRVEIGRLGAAVDAVEKRNYTGFFSTSFWSSLTTKALGLAKIIRTIAFPDVKQSQIDALILSEKARTTTNNVTTGGGGGSGRRRAVANFEALLNRLRKQRIRLEDKLLKFAIKSKKLVAETLNLEKQIVSTRKNRADTGEFTAANKKLLTDALDARIEGERAMLKARQDAELENLDRKHEKENKLNEELREKSRKDFEKEKKKRLGLSSQNAAIRKEIEGELNRIRLATEAEVSKKAIQSLINKSKVNIEGIQLAAKTEEALKTKAMKQFESMLRRETGFKAVGLQNRKKGQSVLDAKVSRARDFGKDILGSDKKLSKSFDEIHNALIKRAKEEEVINLLIDKQGKSLEMQGKLGVAQTKARSELLEKQAKFRTKQELKFTQQRESLDKRFFQRSKKRFDQEKRDRDSSRKKDVNEILANLTLLEKGASSQSYAFKIFVDQFVEMGHNLDRISDISERIAEIERSGNKNVEEKNKLTRERVALEERNLELIKAKNFLLQKSENRRSLLDLMPAGVKAVSAAAERERELTASIAPGVNDPIFDFFAAGLKKAADGISSLEKVSSKVRFEFQSASAFSRENKAEIDALSKDPDMKRLLERSGISNDPEVLASFARRKATGSMIDMGAGNEAQMAIIGAIEKGFSLEGVGQFFGTNQLDDVSLGTNTMLDALDFVVPGIGDAVADSMQELYDSDLHMKMFEDVSAASAEFAQGNVGALFEVASGFAEKVSEKMTSLLSGAARGLGNLIGTSVGNFAGKAFGNTVGPIMQATIGFVADNVLSPIAETLAASFGTMTGGIQSAFSTTADESRLASERRRVSNRARRDLRASTTEISTAARDRTAELDSQIAATSDPQAREELILQRREVIAEMESQLLEARTSFAESERQRLEEHRENNPMLLVDQAFEKAIGLSEKVMFDLPHVAVKVVDGLISNLPTLFTNIADGLVDTIDAIAEKLPELMMTLVRSLIDVIPKLAESLTTLIPQLVKGLLEALIELLSNLGEIIGPLVEMAVTSIIESFIILVDKIPEIAISLVQGIIQAVSVLAEQAPRIIAALIAAVPSLTIALIGAIPQIVAEIIKSIPTILASFGKGLYRAAIDFGRMIGRAFSRLVSFGLAGESGNGAVMGTALGAVAGLALAPFTGGASLLGMGAAGAGFGALVGSFFGDGGMVTDSQRNPATASIMRSLGAAQYSTGGMVSSVQRALSSNPLSSMRRGLDDVPAVLQAGEAVLNRRATAVIGEDTINQLNSGVFNGMSGDTQVTLNIEPNSSGIKNAAAALLPLLIGGVNAEVSRPGSKIRNAINSSSGRPVGSMTVPVSKRSIG